jgi:hypothetical protein
VEKVAMAAEVQVVVVAELQQTELTLGLVVMVVMECVT